MTMAANMLLSRRDNYLKNCSKDVTEDDISKLRNAPFTSNEVFLLTLFLKFNGTSFNGLM